MASQIQRRRGTTAEHSTFTGVEGELTVDTTKDTVVVHDGTTVGGHPLQKQYPALGSASEPTYTFTGDTNTGIYSPGADQLAISTNGGERLRITSAGLVGIGTSSVTNNANLDIQLNTNGGNDTYAKLQLRSGNYGYIIKGGIKQGAGGQLHFDLNNNGSVSTKMVLDEAGRLGIGTASPSSQFHLVSSSAGNYLRLENSAGKKTFLAVEADRSAIYAQDDTAGAFPLTFNIGQTERARIDSSGRLLVGTSSTLLTGSRNAAVQIAGSAADSASLVLRRDAVGPTAPQFVFGKSRSASIGGNTIVQANDPLGLIIFAGADGTDTETLGALIAAEVDGTPGANDMPGRLVFSTTADGASSPTERLRINSAGSLLHGATSAPSKINQPCFSSPNYSGYFISRVNTAGTVYSGVNRTVTLTFPDVNYNGDIPAIGQIEAGIQCFLGVNPAAGSPNIRYVKRVRDFITTTQDIYTSDPTPQQVWLNDTLDMVRGSGINIAFAVSGRVVTITFSNDAGVGQAQTGTVIIRSNVEPTIAVA